MFAKLREKLKGWKTVVWNLFIALSGVIAVALQQLGLIDWSQYVGPIGAVFISLAISAIGIGLRTMTTGPVGSKGEQPATPDTKAGD